MYDHFNPQVAYIEVQLDAAPAVRLHTEVPETLDICNKAKQVNIKIYFKRMVQSQTAYTIRPA